MYFESVKSDFFRWTKLLLNFGFIIVFLAVYPSSPSAWKSLGLLLEAIGEESNLCLLKAAELEQFTAINDYTICPLQAI